MYCVWQVVKTPTIISNNPVYTHTHTHIHLCCCGPTRAMAPKFLRFLDHTQRRTTVCKTPLDEWSARPTALYLHNTRHSQQTSMPPEGFEPTIPASEGPQINALDGATTAIGIADYSLAITARYQTHHDHRNNLQSVQRRGYRLHYTHQGTSRRVSMKAINRPYSLPELTAQGVGGRGSRLPRPHPDSSEPGMKCQTMALTLWRWNYFFFLILAHSVYKMWIIQEPNKLALWNKLHFEERKKNGEYRACLKYSVPIFVE